MRLAGALSKSKTSRQLHYLLMVLIDQARVPPLREPTRSQERTRKKKRRLAPVGMTGFGGGYANSPGDTLKKQVPRFARNDN
jgi:hypothetical protein